MFSLKSAYNDKVTREREREKLVSGSREPVYLVLAVVSLMKRRWKEVPASASTVACATASSGSF